MTIPVVLTAFGTTEKAFSTYARMDAAFRRLIPETPLYWAYSSRMVRDNLKKKGGTNPRSPSQVLEDLRKKGHEWAVVQSLHLAWGHEFERLRETAGNTTIRTSMGLPLLTSFQDYLAVADALAYLIPNTDDEAVVFVGHGTDHPAWAVYPALENVLCHRYGERVFTGVLEGMPKIEETIAKLKRHGFTKVCLIPFLLVAGFHFKKDLTLDDFSWEKRLEQEGIQVRVEPQAMGEIPGIIEIFATHIKEALDVIPR